jgi:hypothetical protein
MEPLYCILIIVVLMYGVFASSSIMVNAPKYKFYKPSYEAIKSGTYIHCRDTDRFSTFRPLSKIDEWWSDDEILFFHDDFAKGSIKLLGSSNYIHGGFFLWCDLYSMYWFYKLHRLAKVKMVVPSIEKAELSKADLTYEPIKDKSKKLT